MDPTSMQEMDNLSTTNEEVAVQHFNESERLRAERARNRQQRRANRNNEDTQSNNENGDEYSNSPLRENDSNDARKQERAARLEQRRKKEQELQQKRQAMVDGSDGLTPGEDAVQEEEQEISLEEVMRQATQAYEARNAKPVPRSAAPAASGSTDGNAPATNGATGAATTAAGDQASELVDDLSDLLTPADVEGPPLDNAPVLTEEAKIYTVYPDIPLTTAERGGGEMRNMEAEGLFVAQKPFVPLKIQNKLEQRLHKDATGRSLSANNNATTNTTGSTSAVVSSSASVWFQQQDGLLNHEPSPVRLFNERPEHWYDPEAPYLQTRFMPPTIVQQTADIALERKYQLNIFLDHVKLYDHPLFSKEDMLAAQLELLYEEYVERQQLNLALFYTQKLQALQQHLKFIKDNPHVPVPSSAASTASSITSPIANRLQRRTAMNSPLASASSTSASDEVGERLMNESRVRDHIRQTRLLRDSEESTDLMLVRKMLAIHKQLKDLQESQPYPPATKISLLVNKIPTDEQHDKDQLKQQLEEEIQELREQHQANFADQLNNYRKNLASQQQQHPQQQPPRSAGKDEGSSSAATPAAAQNASGGSNFPVMADFDEKATRQQIMERFKTTKRKPGKPILIPKLFRIANNEAQALVDASTLPSHEQFRRTEVGKILVFLKLIVNNRFVTKTKAKPIDPATWTVHFNEVMSLQLVKWPDSVKLLLCAPLATSGLSLGTKEVTLAEISLRIPVGEADVTGEAEAFMFHGNQPFKPWWDDSAEGALHESVMASLPLAPPRPPTTPSATTKQGVTPTSSQQQISTNSAGSSASDPNAAGNHSHNHSHYLVGIAYALLGWETVEENGPSVRNGLATTPSKKILQPPIPSTVKASYLTGMNPLLAVESAQKLKEWLNGRSDPNAPWNSSSIQGLLSFGANGRRNMFAAASSTNSPAGAVDGITLLNSVVANASAASANYATAAYYSTRRHERDVHLPPTSNSIQRYKLLKFRNDHPMMTNLVVPLVEAEITRTMFKVPELPKPEETLPALVQQENNSEFLREVRANQVQQLIQSQSTMLLRPQDVLKPLPPSSFDIGKIATSLFGQRRKLRPQRTERAPVNIVPEQKCELLIQINRAFNIPNRKQNQGAFAKPTFNNSAAVSSPDLADMVQPFVQVSFQGKTVRSSTVVGSSPQWNESLMFPFNPPGGDFSSANLEVVSETVYFDIFDEVLTELQKDDRTTTEIHQRVEKRWLGGFSIPFSAIYQNLKVEGNMKIGVPLISVTHDSQLSYQQQQQQQNQQQGALGVNIANTNKPMLGIYATLNPPLKKPPKPQIEEHYGSLEEGWVTKYAVYWVKTIKAMAQCQNRRVQALAIDITGRSLLITRYIKPIKPPQSLLSSVNNSGSSGNAEVPAVAPSNNNNDSPITLAAVVRFVSLVPFLEDSITFVGKSNVWNTSKQFLRMRAGDWEEHAMLLCNYFLFLNKQAWVVLGSGIEGEAAYVLLKEGGAPAAGASNNPNMNVNYNTGGTFHLYNPCTGERFETRDKMCPLRDVACVFNNLNVWANIQKEGEPYRMKNWNFDTDATCWKPLWAVPPPTPTNATTATAAPTNNSLGPTVQPSGVPLAPGFNKRLESVQSDDLEYRDTAGGFVSALEAEIEQAITEGIRKYRARFVPRWNRPCSRILKGFLQRCESHVIGVTSNSSSIASEEDHFRDLAKIVMSYYIHGFPINVPYTDVQDVVKAVFNTNIQHNENQKAEFAIAVEVVPYPCKVCSVWVYVLAITPKD